MKSKIYIITSLLAAFQAKDVNDMYHSFDITNFNEMSQGSQLFGGANSLDDEIEETKRMLAALEAKIK